MRRALTSASSACLESCILSLLSSAILCASRARAASKSAVSFLLRKCANANDRVFSTSNVCKSFISAVSPLVAISISFRIFRNSSLRFAEEDSSAEIQASTVAMSRCRISTSKTSSSPSSSPHSAMTEMLSSGSNNPGFKLKSRSISTGTTSTSS